MHKNAPILFYLLFFFFFLFSCNNDFLPKPKAHLSLEYQKKSYKNLPLERPYTFKVSKNATIVNEPNNWLKIKYPNLKASLDITYRPVQNNLKELLTEAEKLVFKHAVKAEEIIPKDFVNPEKRDFGFELFGMDFLIN